MKALRLNADYEYELFFNKKAPAILNESIEFLLFFLTDRPVYSHKKYSNDYLNYLNDKGIRPNITSVGEYENFWGKLEFRELEKKLNSKLTSVQFQDGAVIINNDEELQKIPCDGSYIIKDPFGMSGQNIFRLLSYTDARRYPLIAERFRNRKFDFSTFKFGDGRVISYENIVNDKFQYKGTIINADCHLNDLHFIKKIKESEVLRFKDKLERILSYYSSHEVDSYYSVDSFVYEEDGELKIQDICEVNYRRTMGSLAYDLIHKYSPTKSGVLELRSKEEEPLFKKFQKREDLLVLSPGDTRFEILLRFTDKT